MEPVIQKGSINGDDIIYGQSYSKENIGNNAVKS
jgi:hypothetical protein